MKTKLQSANISLETCTPRIIALSLLAILLLLALTGHKAVARDAVNVSPAGVYNLISVDGKKVPCTLTHDGTAMTIKSGVFTINTNGTCRSQLTLSVPPRADMSREVKATYTQKDAELTMRWEGAGMTKGHISDSTFTMNNEGMVLSYRK